MDDRTIVVFVGSDELVMLVRLAVAAVCGAALGLERRHRRLKPTGMRTMSLITMGAAIFMLIAKFGFPDGVSESVRIAAGVVSGVGFLGAGIMFLSRTGVKNVTTAATIWIAAGIGLAAGAGLFVLAGVATLVVLLLLVASPIDEAEEGENGESEAPDDEPVDAPKEN